MFGLMISRTENSQPNLSRSHTAMLATLLLLLTQTCITHGKLVAPFRVTHDQGENTTRKIYYGRLGEEGHIKMNWLSTKRSRKFVIC